MNGKSKCKILKDIRRQIAEDNDIEYVTSECKFQGECSGTCPKCEAELRYLEDELRRRQAAGKAVAVAGIAAALLVGTTGCSDLFMTSDGGAPLEPTHQQELQGDVGIQGGATVATPDFMGEPTYPPETLPVDVPGELPPDPTELMGMPVLPPPTETQP